MSIVLNGDSGITTPTYGGADTSEYLVPVTQFKNRIINGAMVIDQRNAGAAVTVTDSYTLDRWKFTEDTDGAASVQQVSDAPNGFNYSTRVTVTTADASIGASQFTLFWQPIEGFNWADFGYGTANARTSTLSFLVKSSLTGTFSGSFENAAGDRSYIFTYTITTANTWEYKTVTIPGDTSGTWLTTNGIGNKVFFTLTAGSTFQGTAGSWGSVRFGATGTTQLMSTLNATWQITGVQLEVGSTATSFDYRPYGTELALCQRYYQKTYDVGTVPGTTYNFEYAAPAYAIGTGNFGMPCGRSFLVAMRATPTITTYDGAGNSGRIAQWGVGNNQSYGSVGATQNQITAFDFGNNTTAGRSYPFAFVANAEL